MVEIAVKVVELYHGCDMVEIAVSSYFYPGVYDYVPLSSALE